MEEYCVDLAYLKKMILDNEQQFQGKKKSKNGIENLRYNKSLLQSYILKVIVGRGGKQGSYQDLQAQLNHLRGS